MRRRQGPDPLEAYVYFDGSFSEPRLDHPECVVLGPDDAVWCGGECGQIYQIREGTIRQVASTGGYCLGLAFDAEGDLFVCDLRHRAVMCLPKGAQEVEKFSDGVPGHQLVTPNYPVFDSLGRLYVSDSGLAHVPGPGIVKFKPDGSGELWHAGPFDFANGLALSEDERTLYVAETFGRRIATIEILPDGQAGETGVLAETLGALPDGLALDRDGRVYVGCYEPSQVLRVGSDGTIETLLVDPEAHLLCHPTNLAFLGSVLLVANLGRSHVTAIEVRDAEGLTPAPYRAKSPASGGTGWAS